jgi:nucleoside-triphosphatase THEP1
MLRWQDRRAALTLPPITALVYTDSDAADQALRQLALDLMERGCRLAGLVQHNRTRPGRSRCDMILEELGSGEFVPISQDRGPHARGCALDLGQLLTAIELVRAQLEVRPDIVILNKFGKTEAEGGGFRELIAEVIDAGIPLVIAVPWRNIESWRHFTGGLSEEQILTIDSAIPVFCHLIDIGNRGASTAQTTGSLEPRAHASGGVLRATVV